MTRRTGTWSDFKRWCQARKLKALPAHPWTIAAYLRWVERRADTANAPRLVRAALDAISRQHLLKTARVPARHATVQRTLELIERRAETRGQRANLFDADTALAQTSAPAPPENAAEEAEALTRRRTLRATPRLTRRRPAH